MREMMEMYQLFGFFQAEWISILALLIIGTLYFLAPVVGYRSDRRGTLMLALWALIAKLAIGLFQHVYVALLLIDRPGGMGGGRGGGLFGAIEEVLPALVALAETAALLAAMVLFVLGLQRLVRPVQPPPAHD